MYAVDTGNHGQLVHTQVTSFCLPTCRGQQPCWPYPTVLSRLTNVISVEHRFQSSTERSSVTSEFVETRDLSNFIVISPTAGASQCCGMRNSTMYRSDGMLLSLWALSCGCVSFSCWWQRRDFSLYCEDGLWFYRRARAAFQHGTLFAESSLRGISSFLSSLGSMVVVPWISLSYLWWPLCIPNFPYTSHKPRLKERLLRTVWTLSGGRHSSPPSHCLDLVKRSTLFLAACTSSQTRLVLWSLLLGREFDGMDHRFDSLVTLGWLLCSASTTNLVCRSVSYCSMWFDTSCHSMSLLQRVLWKTKRILQYSEYFSTVTVGIHCTVFFDPHYSYMYNPMRMSYFIRVYQLCIQYRVWFDSALKFQMSCRREDALPRISANTRARIYPLIIIEVYHVPHTNTYIYIPFCGNTNHAV